VRRHRLVTAVVLVGAVLLGGLTIGGATTSAGASAAVESSGRPDARLGVEGCRLMGRVHVAGGCSRTRCAVRGEMIRFSPNAETCLVGGRSGTSYGSEIDSRVCRLLHRAWVAPVNLCAANPHRDRVLTYAAPQCAAPWSVYVTTSSISAKRATRAEKEGRYDVCVRPSEARALLKESRRTGRKLRTVAVARSATLCELQPGHHFVDGACVQDDAAMRPATVLMVGDSLTWRGTNELARARPSWVIDGQSGRSLGQLDERLHRFQADRGMPTGLVIALGTNPARSFDADRLRAVLGELSEATPVMIVTPYRRRGPSTRAQVRQVDRSLALLSAEAATRPNTCTADWRALVTRRPGLLVDGTHQIRRAEGIWARLVSTSWQRCLTDP